MTAGTVETRAMTAGTVSLACNEIAMNEQRHTGNNDVNEKRPQ